MLRFSFDFKAEAFTSPHLPSSSTPPAYFGIRCAVPSCVALTLTACTTSRSDAAASLPTSPHIASAVSAHYIECSEMGGRVEEASRKLKDRKCPNCDREIAAVNCEECGPMCLACSDQIHLVCFLSHRILFFLYHVSVNTARRIDIQFDAFH